MNVVLATTPRVSVVVCVHNRPRQIVDCLSSLAAAVGDDHEIVVVDDASTDDTPQQVREFAVQHPEICLRLVLLSKNAGVSGARNVGVREARGEVVLFTDSDCLVDPNWIVRLSAPLLSGTVSAVCGSVREPPPQNLAELSFYGNLSLAPQALRRRPLAGCNMGFAREVLLTFPFDEQLTYGCDEDDVARRLSAAGRQIAYVDDARVMHCHPMTFCAYMRQAWRQGRGSAWYWRKHRIYLGRDVLCGALVLLLLPLMLWDERVGWLLIAGALLQVSAVWFNEKYFKRLPLLPSLFVMPVALAYNGAKTLSVLFHLGRMMLGDMGKALIQ